MRETKCQKLALEGGKRYLDSEGRDIYVAAAIIIPEIYHKRIMCSTVIKDC